MNLGVSEVSAGDYRFFTANGPDIAVTRGTLEDPVAFGVENPHVVIDNKPAGYGYAAGGPVYADPQFPDVMVMIYHSERYPKGDEKDYYVELNLAASEDGGASWRHLGPILTSAISYEQWAADPDRQPLDLGGGTFTIAEDEGVRYLYVYFQDDASGGPVSVARAPIDAVTRAAAENTAAPWFKFYRGAWTEPGVGGRSSYVFQDRDSRRHWPYFLSVSYNEFLGQYLMVASTSKESSDEPVSTQLRISTSPDAIHWSPSQLIAQAARDELMYPTVINPDGDALTSGERFFVYYVHSQAGGWAMHEDLNVMRRTLTLRRGGLSSSEK